VGNRTLACIGKGTAKELNSFVKEIHFIGQNVDIKITATQFATELGTSTCLFPISNISNRTIQKAIKNQSQVTDVIVYNTTEKTVNEIPKSEVLIFTSPSNVRSYFSKYKIEPSQIVIAIGPSTGKKISANGISNYHIPLIQGELGIIDLIKSLKI